MKRCWTSLLLSLLLASSVSAQTFTSATIDKRMRIVGSTTDGRLVVLARPGRYTRLQISEDHRTVVWLVVSRIQYHDAQTDVSHLLSWYRAGRRHSFSTGEVFIRDVWFYNDGKDIGVNYGGMHFAGANVLLDALTGKETDFFADRDKSNKTVPAWVEQ
jgi:hypothetical protein